MARIPEVRIGQRWVSTLWVLPISVALRSGGIAVVQQLRTYPAVQQFILTYSGQGNFQPPVYEGFPVRFRILHFLNLLFIAFIIRAGIHILSDHPRLTHDAGSSPGNDWLRLRGPMPAGRMQRTHQSTLERPRTMQSACLAGIGIPGIRHSIWPAGGTSASTCSGSSTAWCSA